MEEGLSCPLRIFILSRSGEEIMWSRSELTLCVKGRGWSGDRSKGKITPWCDLAGTPRGAPDASALSGNGLLPPSSWYPYLLAPALGCTPGCGLTSSCSMSRAPGGLNPVGTLSSQAPAERVFCGGDTSRGSVPDSSALHLCVVLFCSWAALPAPPWWLFDYHISMRFYFRESS